MKELSIIFEKPSPAIPPINADADKSKIAIFNVLDNAIKYTPRGRIEILFSSDPSLLTMSVKDTGIGIPNDQQKFIFQKFFRALQRALGFEEQ